MCDIILDYLPLLHGYQGNQKDCIPDDLKEKLEFPGILMIGGNVGGGLFAGGSITAGVALDLSNGELGCFVSECGGVMFGVGGAVQLVVGIELTNSIDQLGGDATEFSGGFTFITNSIGVGFSVSHSNPVTVGFSVVPGAGAGLGLDASIFHCHTTADSVAADESDLPAWLNTYRAEQNEIASASPEQNEVAVVKTPGEKVGKLLSVGKMNLGDQGKIVGNSAIYSKECTSNSDCGGEFTCNSKVGRCDTISASENWALCESDSDCNEFCNTNTPPILSSRGLGRCRRVQNNQFLANCDVDQDCPDPLVCGFVKICARPGGSSCQADYQCASRKCDNNLCTMWDGWPGVAAFTHALTFEGADPVKARVHDVSVYGFTTFLQEEASADDEIAHKDEKVGFVEFEPGTLRTKDGTIVGEVGIDTRRDSHKWKTVDLKGRYTDPVVIIQAQTYNGKDPNVIRVRNAGWNSFEYYLQEWAYLDGTHAIKETFAYVVFQAGTHTYHGARIFAKNYDGINHEFETVQFANAFASTPKTVLGQVSSDNGLDPVTVRFQNLQQNSIEVRVQEEQAADNEGTHTDETVSVIAFAFSG